MSDLPPEAAPYTGVPPLNPTVPLTLTPVPPPQLYPSATTYPSPTTYPMPGSLLLKPIN
jgi:hypothetical protein